jgi:hypothetical protein
MDKVTLQEGTTAFKTCKRGLLISSIGEHTAHMFYVPRSNSIKVNTLGKNTHVKFGKSLMVTMPDTMWANYEEIIIAAAMGEDVVS